MGELGAVGQGLSLLSCCGLSISVDKAESPSRRAVAFLGKKVGVGGILA